jgi:hypothetical protein
MGAEGTHSAIWAGAALFLVGHEGFLPSFLDGPTIVGSSGAP